MHPSDPTSPPKNTGRNIVVAGSVLAAHVAGLWALQAGLLKSAAVELPKPEPVVVQLIAPEPMPVVAPPPPPAPKPPPPAPAPKPQPKPTPAPKPMPKPQAIKDSTPAPNAVKGSAEPQPPAPPIEAPTPPAPPTPPSPPPAPPAPPAQPVIRLPDVNAAYLSNPLPPYPSISKRMGETGTTIVRVNIDQEGKVLDIQLKKSSGYDRLDQAALDGIRKWRFKPGTSNGTPQPMWVNVPMKWELN